MEQIQRICLNAHYDITNIVRREDMLNVIVPTLDVFISQLTRICGPFARNALIIRADESLGTAMGSEMDMRMFLRDGRHILRNTEFISPIQQYLKTIVLYVGSRIDAVCKDGTTTSMLLACHLIKSLVKHTEDFSEFTLYEIEKAALDLVDLIMDLCSKNVISLEKIQEDFGCTENQAASAIAFLQAYTASGGNPEISKSIATFFGNMPREIWSDRVDHTISRVEKSGYVCKAVECEFEYELKGILLTTQYRNADMRRIVHLEKTDMVIMPYGILDSSLSTDALLSYLTQRIEVDKNLDPLVICSPGGDHCSPKIVEFITAKAREHNVILPVVAYNVNTKAPVPWTALSLCGKANVPMFDESNELADCVIKGIEIKITSTFSHINGLTPTDERLDNDSLIHPGVIYPDDYPFHFKAVDIVNSYLGPARSKHYLDKDEIEELEKAHADLAVRKRMMLSLGGCYHDQLALQPVIEDASGSAMAAIQTGIVTNGIPRLFLSLIELYNKPESHSKLTAHLIRCFLDATQATCMQLTGPKQTSSEFNDLLLDTIYNLGDPFSYFDIVKMSQTEEKLYANIYDQIQLMIDKKYDEVIEYWNKNGYPPIQTAKMINELLVRLQEVAVRVGLTDMIIVPGAAWADGSH